MTNYQQPAACLLQFLRDVYGDLPAQTRVEIDVEALSGGMHGTPHLDATEVRVFVGEVQLLPDFKAPYWKEMRAGFPRFLGEAITQNDRLEAVQELLKQEGVYLEYGLDWPDANENVISPLCFTVEELCKITGKKPPAPDTLSGMDELSETNGAGIPWCQNRSEHDVWFYTNTFVVKSQASFQRFCKEHALEFFADENDPERVGCFCLGGGEHDETFVRELGRYLADGHVALISDVSEQTWSGYPPTVWQVVYAVNNQQQVLVLNPVNIFALASQLGMHITGFQDMAPTRQERLHTSGWWQEEGSQKHILLDLGNGYTLRYGVDEVAEVPFICVSNHERKLVEYCYWDAEELKDDGENAPQRVLGGLLRAGVPILNTGAIVTTILHIIAHPPEGESGLLWESDERDG